MEYSSPCEDIRYERDLHSTMYNPFTWMRKPQVIQPTILTGISPTGEPMYKTKKKDIEEHARKLSIRARIYRKFPSLQNQLVWEGEHQLIPTKDEIARVEKMTSFAKNKPGTNRNVVKDGEDSEDIWDAATARNKSAR
mgnify:CR=1 FL=1